MKIQRVGCKTTVSSSKHGDATSAVLIMMIACLVLTILFLGTPDLTPEQINPIQLWGP
jgi:hypothetical protein